MTDFAAMVRGLVAIADTFAESMQPSVSHEAWIADESSGEPAYAYPVLRNGVVNYISRDRRTADGRDIVQKASILFPRPIAPNGAANRKEPIDQRDRFTLPNGYTGPVLSVEGPADKGTGASFIYEVILG